MAVEEFDLLVVGTGAGLNVASRARSKGMRVALFENSLMGGTCLNKGCIPSKILTYPAEVVRLIQKSADVGIQAKVEKADFDLVRERMWRLIVPDREGMEKAANADQEMAFVRDTAKFTAPYTLAAGGRSFHAPRIVLACGVRTDVPPIPGLEAAGYYTSESIFDIQKLPSSIVIIGGGYKAMEFGHFFSAFGTKVTIVGRNPMLLPHEEPEVSDLVYEIARSYMQVMVNAEVVEVKGGPEKTMVCRDRTTGAITEVKGEVLLVATGVRSNADWLDLPKGNIRADAKGYIMVDKHLETNAPGVYAMGDVIGRTMFRHTANYHSGLVWHNLFAKDKADVDEHAVPHAVFTYPEVASVGLTEAEVQENKIRYFVGYSNYLDCAKGYAMAESDGFVKVLVAAENLKILGASIVGPHAAILVQPLVYLMNAGDGSYVPMARSQVIHPALSECVANAFGNLSDPAHHHHEDHSSGA
jgi:dihydrolipoamide dehydrogenase